MAFIDENAPDRLGANNPTRIALKRFATETIPNAVGGLGNVVGNQVSAHPLQRPVTAAAPAAPVARPAIPAAAPASVVAPTPDPRVLPVNSPAAAVPSPGRPATPGALRRPDGVSVAPYNLPDGTQTAAYAATGASVANAQRAAGVAGQGFGGSQANDTGSYAAPALTRPAPYQAPGTGLDGNRGAADIERKAAISDLDSRLSSLGTLNSRGKRAMASQLLELKTGLTRSAYDQQGELAKTGASINAAGATAALNANAGADSDTAQINATAREGGLSRRLEFDKSGEVLPGANGRQYLRRGTNVTPITGADGKGFEGAPTKQSGLLPKDILDAYTSQLAAIDPLDPNAPAIRAETQSKIDALIGGGAAPAKPTLADFLSKAKAANPGKSDAELTDYFNKKYGQ